MQQDMGGERDVEMADVQEEQAEVQMEEEEELLEELFGREDDEDRARGLLEACLEVLQQTARRRISRDCPRMMELLRHRPSVVRRRKAPPVGVSGTSSPHAFIGNSKQFHYLRAISRDPSVGSLPLSFASRLLQQTWRSKPGSHRKLGKSKNGLRSWQMLAPRAGAGATTDPNPRRRILWKIHSKGGS